MKRFLAVLVMLAVIVPPLYATIILPQPHSVNTVSVWIDTGPNPSNPPVELRYLRWDDQGPYRPGDVLVASGLTTHQAIVVCGPHMVFHQHGVASDFGQ
jgi:hypothetical protein